MPDPITIARLALSYDGGVWSQAGVIEGLDRQRFRTIFIYLTRCSERENAFVKAGHAAYYLYGNTVLNAFRPLILYRLVKVLKAENVGVIHCHRHKPTVYGAIAAKLAGVPVVLAHVHGLNRSKRPRRRLTNRFLFRKVNRILTAGEATRADVLRANPSLPPEKVLSVGNSIDWKRFAAVDVPRRTRQNAGLPEEAFCFVTVGRLVPTKGCDLLIGAFEKVRRKLPSARLVFVGDGRLRHRLEKQAAAADAAGAVHFLGHRNDVAQLLAAMDCFVLASVAEGMPRSLLEAMAAGLPCVGTRVGSIPEILGQGSYGRLAEPADTDSLAEAMLASAAMPRQQRQRLADAAKRHVAENYCHEKVVRQLEQIYREECGIAGRG
jgi:glycosyltransferase involved in cell wall biosynthesis